MYYVNNPSGGSKGTKGAKDDQRSSSSPESTAASFVSTGQLQGGPHFQNTIGPCGETRPSAASGLGSTVAIASFRLSGQRRVNKPRAGRRRLAPSTLQFVPMPYLKWALGQEPRWFVPGGSRRASLVLDENHQNHPGDASNTLCFTHGPRSKRSKSNSGRANR